MATITLTIHATKNTALQLAVASATQHLGELLQIESATLSGQLPGELGNAQADQLLGLVGELQALGAFVELDRGNAYHDRFPEDGSMPVFVPVLLTADESHIALQSQTGALATIEPANPGGYWVTIGDDSESPATVITESFLALLLAARYVLSSPDEHTRLPDDALALLGVHESGQIRIYSPTFDRVATLVASPGNPGGLLFFSGADNSGKVAADHRYFSLAELMQGILMGFYYVTKDDRLDLILGQFADSDEGNEA